MSSDGLMELFFVKGALVKLGSHMEFAVIRPDSTNIGKSRIRPNSTQFDMAKSCGVWQIKWYFSGVKCDVKSL